MKRISYSQYNQWITCPHKWKLNYIDKLIELARSNQKKIKLLPKSKMMYVTVVKKKLEKISELKKFLKLLLSLKDEK